MLFCTVQFAMSQCAAHKEMVVEVVLRIMLFASFWYLENSPPFYRPIKHEELWLYQNPISEHDAIPTPLLMTIALSIPTAYVVTHYFSTRCYVDLRQGLLGLFLSAFLNGVVVDIVKISVGRPRPDFFYRCFPEGKLTSDLQCVGDPDVVMEGRKSFPSGHSSWMFSTFGYLSLYMLAKLQCFKAHGRGEGWRLCIALSPLLAATMVAMSRYQDFKHHWEDIVVGSGLGLLIACLCYHHYYPPVWHLTAHLPHTPRGFPLPGNGCHKPTSPTELEGVELRNTECELGGGNLVGMKRPNRKF